MQDLLFLIGSDRAQRLALEAGELGFQLCDPLQRFVPAAFEGGGDQPVRRIDGLVAAFGEIGFVTRPFDTPAPVFLLLCG